MMDALHLLLLYLLHQGEEFDEPDGEEFDEMVMDSDASDDMPVRAAPKPVSNKRKAASSVFADADSSD